MATNGVSLQRCRQFLIRRPQPFPETFEILGTALLPGPSDMDAVQPANQRGRQRHPPVPVPLLAAGNGSPSVGAYSRTLSLGGPISNPESAYFPGWRTSMAAFDPQENRDGPVQRGFDVDCIAQAKATSRLVSRGHYLPFFRPERWLEQGSAARYPGFKTPTRYQGATCTITSLRRRNGNVQGGL